MGVKEKRTSSLQKMPLLDSFDFGKKKLNKIDVCKILTLLSGGLFPSALPVVVKPKKDNGFLFLFIEN